jgi:hypothetical protein
MKDNHHQQRQTHQSDRSASDLRPSDTRQRPTGVVTTSEIEQHASPVKPALIFRSVNATEPRGAEDGGGVGQHDHPDAVS